MTTNERGARPAGWDTPTGRSDDDERQRNDTTADAGGRESEGAHALSPRHLADLAASGIDKAAAKAHGFRTVTSRDELIEIGFPETQAKKLVKHLPALAIPSYRPDGKVAGYQLKPDRPRLVGGKGRNRPIRYETADGAANVLDFGPSADVGLLADPRCPLFIVEGVKKAVKLRIVLAAAGKRAVVIALTGVWGWKATSDSGGKGLAHPLLVGGAVALNDNRLVLIAFDSDVWSRVPGAKASRGVSAPAARLAAEKLAKVLTAFGAGVKFIVLRPLDDGGKQGIDDFLTAGGTLDELDGFVQDDPPQEPAAEADTEWAGPKHHPYREQDGATYYLKRMTEGGTVPVLLANFTARIDRETALDDGVERTAHYEIVLRCNGREIRDRVVASRFAGLGWVASAEAIITPGQASRDHFRAAVQHLSAPVESVVTYAHTGWRKVDGHGWVYLHAAGAIGPNGPVAGVQTHLSDLPHYRLPDPPEGDVLRDALGASLRLRDLAPLRVTAPIFGAIYRAPIGGTTSSVFVAGRTGRRKTALVALAQQHYGSEMDAEHLPGNWTSTENTLEAQCFLAKDALFPIDDFCPAGSKVDHERHHARAARIFRATGNHSARGRMRADRSLDPARPPRCLVVATGEDVPRGQSIRARMFLVEIEENDVDLDKLTACQRDAAAGIYAEALAGYLQWLAPQLDDVRARQVEIHHQLRDELRAVAGHARVPANLAELACGVGWFLEFAVDVGAIEIELAKKMFSTSVLALIHGSKSTARYLTDTDAATRYLELLAAAVTSGEAYLADEKTGAAPLDQAAHGWRRVDLDQWHTPPAAKLIGWVATEKGQVWIDPDAAFAVVCALAAKQGETFTVGQTTITKRLHEAGHLQRSETESDGSIRYAVRETPRSLGRRMRVLVLGPTSSWISGPIGPSEKNPTSTTHFSWPGFSQRDPTKTGPRPAAQSGPEIREPGPTRTGPRNGTSDREEVEQNRGSDRCGPTGPEIPRQVDPGPFGFGHCLGCGADLPADVAIGLCRGCLNERAAAAGGAS